MKDRVNVGVVGLGMGMSHISAFGGYVEGNPPKDRRPGVLAPEEPGEKGHKIIPEANLVAICDFQSEPLRKVAELYGAKAYSSYLDMVRDPEVEAVAIASPSFEHTPMVILAALHGKHALVEKPVATDLSAAERMVEVARKNKVKLGCIFQSRLDPVNIRMKEDIESGRLGRIFLLEGIVKWWRDDKTYYHQDEQVEMWKGTWYGEGGGALANQGIHTVDQLCWLMNFEVEEVYGYYDRVFHTIQAEDFTAALLRYSAGAIGYITCTTSLSHQDLQETRVSVYGTKGTLSRIGDRLVRRIQGEPEVQGAEGAKMQKDTLTVQVMSPHTEQCRDFIRAILEDRDPIVTGESASKALEVVKAVYLSCQQREPVKLPLKGYF
jgi:UDP-N-acetyl-2-amino-2-deoxyglucuronate dehydrogenase